MKTLILCVTYKTRPGMRDAFIREVLNRNILDITRREEGCLGYEYYCSVTDGDEILLMEQWASRASQQAHLQQPHMAQLKDLKEQYVLSTRLESLIPEEKEASER